MATTEQWHNEVTASIGGAEKYGQGCWPNPWLGRIREYQRRHEQTQAREELTRKILMLTEPRFITGCETSELMEALVTMTGAKQLLELGTHTGRTALHLLRAIVGVEGAKLVSIDARPTHHVEFFAKFSKHFEHISGWTPQCLDQLAGRTFDFVFVDSDHSVEHTQKELAALLKITKPGTMFCFHDCPEWQTPGNRVPPPVRTYLLDLIARGEFAGMMLPSPEQLDCLEEWGPNYPKESNPGLAVLIRKK